MYVASARYISVTRQQFFPVGTPITGTSCLPAGCEAIHLTKPKPRKVQVVTESETPSAPAGAGDGDPPVVRLEHPDPRLESLFAEFAERCHRFSREIAEEAGIGSTAPGGDHVRVNMQIARTVFSKWSIDILAFLYTGRQARFQEIKNAMGDVSSRVLSLKLSRMERLGLLRRAVLETRPPHVQYSLTDKGLRVARLGEPVFLYLRLTQGLSVPDVS